MFIAALQQHPFLRLLLPLVIGIVCGDAFPHAVPMIVCIGIIILLTFFLPICFLMNWKYWLILIISVIILIIAPGLFTQTAIFDFWKFDTVTGSVGDTIGGTTAPIVGLISIFLLVATLWEQKN